MMSRQIGEGPMAQGFAGNVDISRQSHAEGWAARGREAVRVAVHVNGARVGEAVPSRERPDVEAAGFARTSGWFFTYPRLLDADDSVAFLLPDGSSLPFAPGADHAPRLRSLTHGLDRSMVGLELGPLNLPLLGKPRWDVAYVDHAPRAELERKYGSLLAGDPTQAALVDVDIVWPRGPLASCLPVPRAYDFAVASHVIEHVPDMVRWLAAVAEVLVPGGRLNLAVPDRDRTFDRFRAPTRAAEIVDDYMLALERPGARHIFDHVCYFAEPGQGPQYRPAAAMATVEAAAAEARYLDVHCRVFTCESFLDVFRTLADAGLVRLELVAFFATRPEANEFIVSLRRADGSGPATLSAGYARCLAALPGLREEAARGGAAMWVAG